MDLIGDTLRRARVRQGLRLEQVAAKTKIASHFLHAMEENRFENLPGGLFTRSFLRQYTQVLGLNEEEIVASLKQQFEEPPLPLPLMPVARKSLYIPPMPAVAWLVLSIVACGGVYTLWENVRRSLPVIKAASTAGLAAQPAPKPNLKQVAPADTIASQSSVLDPPTVHAASGLVPDTEGIVRAMFTATEAVWISVKSDGVPVFTGTLEGTQSKEFDTSGKMTVLVGNAGGLKVSVNGTPVEPIGAHGQVRSLVLTSKGAKILPRAPSSPVEPAAGTSTREEPPPTH